VTPDPGFERAAGSCFPPAWRHQPRLCALPGLDYPWPCTTEAEGNGLAKTNYAFAKRQRDLAKKQKSEAKRQRKSEPVPTTPSTTTESTPPGEKTVE